MIRSTEKFKVGILSEVNKCKRNKMCYTKHQKEDHEKKSSFKAIHSV